MGNTISGGGVTSGVPSDIPRDPDTLVGGQSPVPARSEFSEIDQQVYQTMVARNGSSGSNAPSGDFSVPVIASPSQEFSANDLVDLLREIRSKNQDKQLDTAQKNLDLSRMQSQKNTDNQLAKIKEWADKSAEADKQSLASKIFGWIGKIFAAIAAIASVVVAALATAATGGAAAPLLAVAIIGAISATLSLANQISQEAGGPEISISNLLNTVIGKVLEAAGVPKDQIDSISKTIAGAVALVTLAVLVEPQLMGNMAEGIAKLSGADEATAKYIGMAVGIAAAVTVGIGLAVASGGVGMGKVVQDAIKSMDQGLKVLNAAIGAFSGISQGVTSAAQGGINIATAVVKRDAENILASKKELEAMMIKLQKQMEEGEQDIKKILQAMQDSTQMISKMISDASDSMQQITSNIGKRSTV